MDPNSGKLYSSVAAAKRAGVENPVEIIGTPQEVRRISNAVKKLHAAEQKKAKRKETQKSKRVNRGH